MAGATDIFYYLLTTDEGATFDNGLGHYVQNCTFRNCRPTAFAGNSQSSKIANRFLENCLSYGTTPMAFNDFLDDHMRNNLVAEREPFRADDPNGECRFVKGLTDAGYPRVGSESETDLVGKKRVLGAAIDIGCCEHRPQGLMMLLK